MMHQCFCFGANYLVKLGSNHGVFPKTRVLPYNIPNVMKSFHVGDITPCDVATGCGASPAGQLPGRGQEPEP